MDRREPRANLNRADKLIPLNRPHTGCHRSLKNTCRLAGHVREVYRHNLFELDMSQSNTRLQERPLKRITAPDHKGHQIVAPVIRDLFHLVDTFPLLIYSVTRQISPYIRSLCQISQKIIPGFRNFQNRAGFGIPLTEEKKIESIFFRQDHEIGLSVSVCTSFGRAAEFTLADELPDCSRMQISDLVFIHDSCSIGYLG
jgi:hypothetical protein